MIALPYQIMAAVLLDLLIGDPRWFPHPVRLIGRFAMVLERPARAIFRWPRLAGFLTALVVIAAAGFAAYGLIYLAGMWNPRAADVVSILLMYTCFAARDLAGHAAAVFRALADDDLAEARRRVGMMVGRDTQGLDKAGITRATVESVAENIVDGVTAPLLYAAVFGPVGAIVYKAINTLDSTFGYKNSPYPEFGWASARIDDVANYLPARLTAPLIAIAAFLLRQRPGGAVRILVRDRRKHDSPNAGYPEAAVAGALGVQLGGTSSYFDGRVTVEKPRIGDPAAPLNRTHIRNANRLMYLTAALFLIACVAGRVAGERTWMWLAQSDAPIQDSHVKQNGEEGVPARPLAASHPVHKGGAP